MAAVYAAVSLLPGFPVIGAPGAEIDLARSLEPSYGIALGAALGPLSAFTGAVIGKVVSGEMGGLIFTPLALVSTFSSAAISKKKIFKIPGGALSGSLLLVLIVAWLATPHGQSVPHYAAPHVAAALMALLFGGGISGMLKSESKAKITLGLALVSYIATMTGNMLGNLVFIAAFDPNPLFFLGLFPVMLVERLAISAASTIIGVPLLIAFRKLDLDGPSSGQI
ncbi:MAG: hypothetical protein QFX35_01085 [Candidatus Verstraetearchaeota archaeon]|nr:hypothetical protein [Candidatus Verstraetearchaeota archaeon]